MYSVAGSLTHVRILPNQWVNRRASPLLPRGIGTHGKWMVKKFQPDPPLYHRFLSENMECEWFRQHRMLHQLMDQWLVSGQLWCLDVRYWAHRNIPYHLCQRESDRWKFSVIPKTPCTWGVEPPSSFLLDWSVPGRILSNRVSKQEDRRFIHIGPLCETPSWEHLRWPVTQVLQKYSIDAPPRRHRRGDKPCGLSDAREGDIGRCNSVQFQI